MGKKDSLNTHPLVVGTQVLGAGMVNETRKAAEFSKDRIRPVVEISKDVLEMIFMPCFYWFVIEMEKVKREGLRTNIDLSDIVGPACLQAIRLIVSIGAAVIFEQPSVIDATVKGFAVAGVIDAGLLAVYYLGYREKAEQASMK